MDQFSDLATRQPAAQYADLRTVARMPRRIPSRTARAAARQWREVREESALTRAGFIIPQADLRDDAGRAAHWGFQQRYRRIRAITASAGTGMLAAATLAGCAGEWMSQGDPHAATWAGRGDARDLVMVLAIVVAIALFFTFMIRVAAEDGPLYHLQRDIDRRFSGLETLWVSIADR